MLKIDKGYKDTPIKDVTSLQLKRGLVNFHDNFRVKSELPDEVWLTNLTSPLDRQEKFRFAYNEVKDIYRNTDIDPSVYSPTRRGVNVLVQLTETFSATDDTNPKFRVDLPISAHLVLKLPSSANITAQDLEEVVGRLLSGLYETGQVSSERILALLRGSLVPIDL